MPAVVPPASISNHRPRLQPHPVRGSSGEPARRARADPASEERREEANERATLSRVASPRVLPKQQAKKNRFLFARSSDLDLVPCGSASSSASSAKATRSSPSRWRLVSRRPQREDPRSNRGLLLFSSSWRLERTRRRSCRRGPGGASIRFLPGQRCGSRSSTEGSVLDLCRRDVRPQATAATSSRGPSPAPEGQHCSGRHSKVVCKNRRTGAQLPGLQHRWFLEEDLMEEATNGWNRESSSSPTG